MQKFWCALFLCFGLAVATEPLFCSTVKELTAVDLSFKSHEDHVLYGHLAACPAPGASLTSQSKFKIINNDDRITLLDDHTGEFVFRPTRDLSGVESFYYEVEDYQEGQLVTSRTAKVLVSLRAVADVPHLSVDPISGVPNQFYDLNIKTSLVDKDGSEDLRVTLCNCNERPKCSFSAERCECELTLPSGWEIQTHLLPLRRGDLQNLLPYQAQDLSLSTFSTVSADKCISVYAISIDRQGHMARHAMNWQQLNISVHHGVQKGDQISILPQHPTPISTKEGGPVLFNDIRISHTKAASSYQVRIQVDQGGTLWVRKNVDDVVFNPKDFLARNNTGTLHQNREIDRDENFYDYYRPHDITENNNGRQTLEFTGTLQGVNRVLSSLVFVPWCAKWPTPPNWDLPESSWMVPTEWDQVLSEDPRHPAIWPQWYPRFWYPFSRKTWNWWPRVYAPYWLNDICSDWTSRVSVSVKELVPSEVCQSGGEEEAAVAPPNNSGENSWSTEWLTEINVEANMAPKSLIARNLFSYFNEGDESVMVNGLYIRSLEMDNFKLRFSLRLQNPELARIESTVTGMPNFACYSLQQCNELLDNIKVTFREGTSGFCQVPIEVKMYKENSVRLADMIVLWAYKVSPECTDIWSTVPDFSLNPPAEPVTIRQGETESLELQVSHLDPDMKGIIHARISARDGLASLTTPDGVRVYFDHMAVHQQIPTGLCMAGPAAMVLEALQSIKFTPIQDFRGTTKVTIEYGMPTTASQLAFGEGVIKAKELVEIQVEVEPSDSRPSLPLLQVPRKVCVEYQQPGAGRDVPLDMIRLENRFQQENIQLSFQAEQGSIKIDPAWSFNEETYSDLWVTEEMTLNGKLSRVNSYIQQGGVLYTPPECHSEQTIFVPINIKMVSLVTGEQKTSIMELAISCQEEEESSSSEEERGNNPHLVGSITIFPQRPETLETSEGRPFLFQDLRISDRNPAATYHVQVSVNTGGKLWVRQNRNDVIFSPPEWWAHNTTESTQIYQGSIHRDDDFNEYYVPHDESDSNNGRSTLEFLGSLDGVNEVLSSMLYVPWCAKWPLPPNWNLPESSWMIPTPFDKTLTEDPHRPAVWPQWYPRFWYPFPEKSWTWWPRVWAPYWLNDVCSDWTSRVNVRVQEVKPTDMCQANEMTNVGEWSTDINVRARTAPKSLIARSLFSYFDEDSESVMMRGLYIRSLETNFIKLRFTLSTPNPELAHVISSITNHDNFTCEDLTTCNELLASIRVYFKKSSSTDFCNIPVVVKMYKGESSRLADMIYLWAYKTTPQCVNVHTTEDFAVDTEDVQVTQGETGTLNIKPTHMESSQVEGIIHAKISAQHGLVSFDSPDGLRVYFDHMGIQNERLPTKLCVSGPAHMVLQAISTARFTPLKDFLGPTTILVDYGLPTTAATLAYDEFTPPPKNQRLEISVTVVEGRRPALPLLSMPQRFCANEMELEDEVPLDMILFQDRFHQGYVTVTLTPDRGTVRSKAQSEHLGDTTIRSTSSGGLVISSPVNTISPLFLAGIFTLEPESCTSSVPETSRLRVKVESHGQSMDQVMEVEVKCGSSSLPSSPSPFGGEICSEEEGRWDEWSECLADQCRTGLQWRQRLCGIPRREERPCLNCHCQPFTTKIRNPSLDMRGCHSLSSIQQCPPACKPVKVSYQSHEFECPAGAIVFSESEERQVMVNSESEEHESYAISSFRTAEVEVHLSCACRTCTTRREQAKTALPF